MVMEINIAWWCDYEGGVRASPDTSGQANMFEIIRTSAMKALFTIT